MLRKERVWRTLSELCHRKLSDDMLANHERVGFTTVEVADLLTLDRANTSRDLNQLVEEGRVVKLAGKPVLYLDRFFLEERLGEPLNLSQTRFNSLAELSLKSNSLPLPFQTFYNNSVFSPKTTQPRAVRWLDLPDENFEQTPQTKLYRLGVVVVAHGRTTASSMTEVACRLASVNGECAGGLALDVELEDDLDAVLTRTEALVKASAISNPDGVLLLVDLPKLAGISSVISQHTGLKLNFVENVNTAMLVEALHCVTSGRYSLDELTQHLRQRIENEI